MYSVGVVAHESRLRQAKQLAEQVSAEVLEVDDDNLRLGCEANHRRVWQALLDESSTPWLVVLEDDAQPVDDFPDQLSAALSVAPAPFVSLYLGKGFPRHWQQRIRETVESAGRDTCWATSGWMLHAVGIAVRTELVPGMLRHLDRAIGLPIDQAIGQHARNTGQLVAYTLPSLVDHADAPTVIAVHQDGQPRTPGRKAWTVGKRPRWTTHSIQMG